MEDTGPPPVCEFDGSSDGGEPDAGASDGGADAGLTDAGMDAGPSDAGVDAAAEGGADAAARPEPAGLIVLYEFDEGSGSTVFDRSGLVPAADLTIVDEEAVSWGPGRLSIDGPTILRTMAPPLRLIEAIRRTGEITVEAWVRPATMSQSGPARIVTLSVDTSNRNFTLGQESSTVILRLRTTATSSNGIPATQTAFCTFFPRRTHLVYTRDHRGAIGFYIDGVLQGSAAVPGTLENWDDTYELALANELTGSRAWSGEFFRVALYDDALSADEVVARFEAGPDAELR